MADNILLVIGLFIAIILLIIFIACAFGVRCPMCRFTKFFCKCPKDKEGLNLARPHKIVYGGIPLDVNTELSHIPRYYGPQYDMSVITRELPTMRTLQKLAQKTKEKRVGQINDIPVVERDQKLQGIRGNDRNSPNKNLIRTDVDDE